MHRPLVIPIRSVLWYFVRFLVCLFTMEAVLHFMYVVAIKNTRAWARDSPSEIAMIGFWNLIVVWLKVFPCVSTQSRDALTSFFKIYNP